LHGVGVAGVFLKRQGHAFVGLVAQQFRVRLDDALRFVPRVGSDEAVEQVGQGFGGIAVVAISQQRRRHLLPSSPCA
jgi:hypothetical protein